MLISIYTPALAQESKKEGKLTLDEVLAKHLDSIGKQDSRSSWTSVFANGFAVWKIIVGGSGLAQGSAKFLTEGKKFSFSIDYNLPQYSGERFAYDGKHGTIGHSSAGNQSRLGIFVINRTDLGIDGLIGGSLSTAWPLLDIKNRRIKLRYEGLKTIKRMKLHEIKVAEKNGLVSSLYFDPETFHHVMSVHQLYYDTPAGESHRLFLEETFSDFRPIKDGKLTLPFHWNIHYTVQQQFSSEWEWDITFQNIESNIAVNPESFSAE